MEIRITDRLPVSRTEKNAVKPSSVGTGKNFAQVLREATGVKFSKHAEERLRSMSRDLTEDEFERLETAMNMAQAKGARTTLVVMNGVFFVVAPQNRTVVTVVDEARAKENVFTSIDSAVLMNNE